jgi:REP element-mobilizing transposase RayT
MPRPPRVHIPGALYYISSRAVQGVTLFKDGQDYETYLELLREARQQFAFKLFAYVVLPDQLHLCLELTNATTISEIMHALNSRYTKSYAKQYGPTSHLFERFKSTIAEKAPSLLRLTSYLHTEPLRRGVTGDLRAYRWSSYPTYLAAGASQLDLRGEVQEVLDALGREHPGMTYEAYVQSIPEREWDELRQALGRWAVGSEAFVEVLQRRRQAVTHQTVESTRPAPQPQPRHRVNWSPALTMSLGVALLSLCAAWLYARNLSALKQTLGAVLQEQRSLLSLSAQPAAPTATAQLATLTQPSRLTGTSWEIKVQPMTAMGQQVLQTDDLEFRDGKVSSRQLTAQGFPPSNYTLSVQPRGVVVWETMQTSPTGEVVCWRGEWTGERMYGVMTRQSPGQPTINFSFVGQPQREAIGTQTSET